MNIKEADQGYPYKVFKNRLLHSKEYKKILYIINKNIPNITPEEIAILLKKLSKEGCSVANLANILATKLYKDENEFTSMFGFSLNDEKSINYNILMVDIFSSLYDKVRARIISYDIYKFSNIFDACNSLLNCSFTNENEAYLALTKSGYIADGIDSNNNLIFRKTLPNIDNITGTIKEIAKEKFNNDTINTKEELDNLAKMNNSEIYYKDLNIYDKLGNITTDNFNYWSNYYLGMYNLDIMLNQKQLVSKDFNNDYDLFKEHLNNLISQGYLISISSPRGSEVMMHTDKKLSWTKISSDKAGHVMTFKCFNNDNDIVVSTYGENHIIPKEYFNMLEFKVTEIINKQQIKEK